ncbi:hypothetical protein QUB80_33700 [Chlorogloeopsis sp. ULAP01]|uniref:hypothetical protein n=1 Tax=Chlorogloeopsis sp. ULAP01 TaxID=3056483 RepID=UPI0025AAC6D6|nr:hypothetical protein [Chlorogloeopsis sp. ULAP01]MDM9385613.1 hypothetical protein [Chlorogloeopsis sp. ULAP01]
MVIWLVGEAARCQEKHPAGFADDFSAEIDDLSSKPARTVVSNGHRASLKNQFPVSVSLSPSPPLSLSHLLIIPFPIPN